LNIELEVKWSEDEFSKIFENQKNLIFEKIAGKGASINMSADKGGRSKFFSDL
jgi:hypothetical protein